MKSGYAANDTGRADDRFSAAPTALGSSSGSISQPFRAGLTFGQSALRALHLWRSLPCHFSLNLPQTSHLLLGMTREGRRRLGKWLLDRRRFSSTLSGAPVEMTKRGVGFSIRDRLRGSQISRARPGARLDLLPRARTRATRFLPEGIGLTRVKI